MFPRYNHNNLFDVDNFFQSNIIDNNEDPNRLINRINRLSTTFPTYPIPAWQPISRMSPHGGTMTHPVQNTVQNIQDQYRNETFRIRMTLQGYNRDDIKTYVENGKLVVHARHVEWLDNDEDFAANEIKKHFFIPENCNFSEMKSNYDGQNFFINLPLKKSPRSRAASTSSYRGGQSDRYSTTPTKGQHFNVSGGNDTIVDHLDSLPAKPTEGRASHRGSLTNLHNNNSTGRTSKRSKSESESFDFEEFFRSSFRPSIVDTPNGDKKLTMSLPLSNVNPDDINLSLRDSLLTLKINERAHDASNDFTRTTGDDNSTLHHVRSVLLPPKTDLDGLRSRLDNGVLLMEAPYKVD
ncbi:hypothetical protein GJ496_001645 [Pomphorhynchus laevis]|nr:hypothetical protein GJ496_001645 [Pomphorhynchus laevis]